jgi:nifR3 family TIM-barrel protein
MSLLPNGLKIGRLALKNRLILAPMAGITDLPVRLLAREQGASLCFTEMVSVNGLVRDGRKTFELLRSSTVDRPLGVQLFGDNPEFMAEAAKLVAGAGDLIDINMGCPVRKVVSTGAGSSLLREPAKVAAIIRAVRRATDLPLTIKIRTGWDAGSASFMEIGRIAEAEGCDAVTLHPRSRAQMFEGKADWSRIGALKEILRIPVIGSGDIFTSQDAANLLEQSGCDGVMFARGALGNPWIFRETLSRLAGSEPYPPTRHECGETALRHLDMEIAHYGERVALREIRKQICWYARAVPGAARFRALVNQVHDRGTLVNALAEFFELERT